MPEVVNIIFRDTRTHYHFDSTGMECQAGDWVIVETSRGLTMGKVIAAPVTTSEKEVQVPLKPIQRKASEEELQKYEELKQQEPEVLYKCVELVAKHNLPMKLIAAEYNFDGTHLTIYFTSEGKVDFRALLKEMGSTFKTRVELRQIGARDAAKLLGGIGKCGRVLCCTTFLNKFVPISVRMARDQSLPLNPATISGDCGKLLCCLKYEHDQYLEMKSEQPAVGARVTTPQGNGILIEVNILKQTARVKLENDTIVEVGLSTLSAGK